MADEKIRTFIAVDIPEKLKGQVAVLMDKLKKADGVVKWVEPSAMHFTLKFLGHLTFDRLEEVMAAVEKSVAGHRSFTASLEGLGVFPNFRRLRVIWLGVTEGTTELVGLQGKIDKELSAVGFPPEERSFSPHLTLGRVKDSAGAEDRRRLASAIEQDKNVAVGRFEVSAVKVMRSVLRPQGPLYSVIKEFSL